MKPLLAATAKTIDDIPFPCLCTPKLDGIRCLTVGGKAVTRSLKPIPNKHIRETLEGIKDIDGIGLDGELMAGDTFSECSSAVMRREGQPDFRYVVFDIWTYKDLPYTKRMEILGDLELPDFIVPLLPGRIKTKEEFFMYEKAACEDDGAEGVMIRSPNGIYKYGRSTVREGILLKWKRFTDGEAEVVEFIEKMHNANEAKKNKLGRTERSHHLDNMIPMDTLGAVMVRDCKTGVEFKIGTGFDDELRQKIWSNKGKYKKKLIKYKSQPFGKKDKPRFPVFLGFRDKRDM